MENMQNVGTKSAFTPKKYFKKQWELRPRGTLREREREREWDQEMEVWGVESEMVLIRGEAMLEVRGRKFETRDILWEFEIRESCMKIYSYF